MLFQAYRLCGLVDVRTPGYFPNAIAVEGYVRLPFGGTELRTVFLTATELATAGLNPEHYPNWQGIVRGPLAKIEVP